MDQLGWTTEQMNLVKDVISAEVEEARLCHNFIHASEPPLGEDARSVRADRCDKSTNTVGDVTHIPLVEVSAEVVLTPAQVVDEKLSVE